VVSGFNSWSRHNVSVHYCGVMSIKYTMNETVVERNDGKSLRVGYQREM
jgi:hypothetical protein